MLYSITEIRRNMRFRLLQVIVRLMITKDQDRISKSSLFDVNPYDKYTRYHFLKNTNCLSLCLCNCYHLLIQTINPSLFCVLVLPYLGSKRDKLVLLFRKTLNIENI